jgi:FkbM family methyltransferase
MPSLTGVTVKLEAHDRSVLLSFDDPDDHISRGVIERKRFYEDDLLEDARKRMRQGLVIDVGAHVGNHTVYFAGICGAKVVAFEPNPLSFVQLQRNVRLNDLDVLCSSVALGAEPGKATVIQENAHNSGMTRVVPDANGSVQIRTLDSYTFADVSVLKIDAEDSDLDVLRGAAQLLRREKPLLYIEARTHKHRVHIEDYLGELTVAGKKLGYRLLGGPFGWTPTWAYG